MNLQRDLRSFSKTKKNERKKIKTPSKVIPSRRTIKNLRKRANLKSVSVVNFVA